MSSAFHETTLAAHQDELLRFIFRKVNCPEIAQDIFQDTYIRYANYPAKDQIDNHRAFLFRIAANLSADHERRSRVRERFSNDQAVDLEAIAQPDNLQPEQLLAAQERLDLLAQAVEKLPPRCREVFILRKVKEYSHAQIADRLGISRSMVEKHLHHALEVLQKAIDALD